MNQVNEPVVKAVFKEVSEALQEHRRRYDEGMAQLFNRTGPKIDYPRIEPSPFAAFGPEAMYRGDYNKKKLEGWPVGTTADDIRHSAIIHTAAVMASRLKISDKPRFSRELEIEHGNAEEGLLYELKTEAAVLLAGMKKTKREPEGEISPLGEYLRGRRILRDTLDRFEARLAWPRQASNNISRRLYVNRVNTVQLTIPIHETRLARSDELLRAWEEDEHNQALHRLLLAEPLPPRERQALLLHLSEHSDSEAARVMQIESGTYRRYLFNLRERLRRSPRLHEWVFG